ncbi:MAG: flavin reductase family protein [Patescibacteria group bacterium]
MKRVTPQDGFAAFKPESCIFVLSVDGKGAPSGMIAGWHMKCSFEPPLYAVALSKEGFTHKLIQQSKEFVVAVANKKLERAVRLFGSIHGNEVDKFRKSKLKTIPARFTRTPLLADATINLECSLAREVDAGDHYIFIGRVEAAHRSRNKKVLFNTGQKCGVIKFREL